MNLNFESFLRHKDAYEAADTGISLWRKDFIYFIIYFAIPFWVCAFLLRLLHGRFIYLSWFILWYLKPLFERLILHVVSIRFFEPDADIKRLNKGLLKNLFRGLLGDLLWRRISPFRSAIMPILVLEKSKNISERKELLAKGGLGYSFLLTFWGLALEIALLLGEMFFIGMMSRFIGIEIDFFNRSSFLYAENFIFALWCFNYILIETIYVCMGFGVYINSRIEMEGWDIEILFKSFAEKHKKKNTLGLILVLCFLFIFVPASVSAQDIDDVPLEKLEKVLFSPEFGAERDSWVLRLKNPPEETERTITINENQNEFIKWLAGIFASGLRIFLIIIAAVSIIILFFNAKKNITNKYSLIKDHSLQTSIQKNTHESPEALLEKAIEYFNKSGSDQELLRLSYGLCAASAIQRLRYYRGIAFPPNATENDCIAIARAKLGDANEENGFCRIITTWINFAYAGKLPKREYFEEAFAFCKLISCIRRDIKNR